jgi:hypothetical protein
MYLQQWCVVHLANSKSGARHNITATQPGHDTTGKRGLTATQVTDQLDNLTASQAFAELAPELLCLLGTDGVCLPSHYGTHICHMILQLPLL